VKAPQFRVWVGWRNAALKTDWDGFLRQLSSTFIPATWMVMRRHGLISYVPSVTRPDLPHGCPEETALLIYETREQYEGHSGTVGGRSYGLMHRAVFSFDLRQRSRSSWAETWPTPPNVRLKTSFWSGRGDHALALNARKASVVFVLVGHDSVGVPGADALYEALGYVHGDVVLCLAETFTLAWIATPACAHPDTFAHALSAVLPGGTIHASHLARPADTDADFFLGPDGSVAVSDDETLRFLA